MFRIIARSFNWLLGRETIDDFGIQFFYYQKQLRSLKSQAQKNSNRAVTIPHKITKLFLLFYLMIIAPLLTYHLGFQTKEQRIQLGVFLALALLVNSVVMWLVRRVVRLYYDRNENVAVMNMEELLKSQRETLDRLKKKTDFETTNLLVKKYETAIRYMGSRLRNENEDFRNDDEGVEDEYGGGGWEEGANDDFDDEYPHGELVVDDTAGVLRRRRNNNAISATKLTNKRGKHGNHRTGQASVGTQTDLTLLNNRDNSSYMSLLQQRETNSFIHAVHRSKSLNSIESPQELLSIEPVSPEPQYIMPKDDEDEMSDASRTRSRSRSFSSSGSPSASPVSRKSQNDNRLLLEQKMQQIAMLTNNLSRKEQELAHREQEIQKREREMHKRLLRLKTEQQRAPLTPTKLYGNVITNKCDKQELMAKNFGGGWMTRIVDRLMGQSPEDCLALICDRCHSHNGLLMLEDGDQLQQFNCWRCGYQNAKLLVQNKANSEDLQSKFNESLARESKNESTRTDKAESSKHEDKVESKEIFEDLGDEEKEVTANDESSVEYDAILNTDDVSDMSDEGKAAVIQEFDNT